MLINISHQGFLNGKQKSAQSSKFSIEHTLPLIDTISGRLSPRQRADALRALHNSLVDDVVSPTSSSSPYLSSHPSSPYPSSPAYWTSPTAGGRDKVSKLMKNNVKNKGGKKNKDNKDSKGKGKDDEDGTDGDGKDPEWISDWKAFNKGIDERLNTIMRGDRGGGGGGDGPVSGSGGLSQRHGVLSSISGAVGSMNASGSAGSFSSRKQPNSTMTPPALGDDIKAWQAYSILKSQEMKSESHIALPILGYTSAIMDQKKASKSAKSKILMVKSSSASEYEQIQGPSSYVEVVRKIESERKSKL